MGSGGAQGPRESDEQRCLAGGEGAHWVEGTIADLLVCLLVLEDDDGGRCTRVKQRRRCSYCRERTPVTLRRREGVHGVELATADPAVQTTSTGRQQRRRNLKKTSFSSATLKPKSQRCWGFGGGMN